MPVTSTPPPFVWVFEAEPQQWVPFAPEDSMMIEGEFLKSVASVNLQLRGIDYFLDFQKLLRRNTQSGSERKLQRVPFEQLKDVCANVPMPPAGQQMQMPTGPAWLFCDEKGTYMAISEEDSTAVEAVYKTGNPSGKVTLRGVEYELDFTNWKRKNLGSGSERAVRRVDPTAIPPFQPCEPGVMWFLKDEQGCWIPYTPEDTKAIETAFQTGGGAAAQVSLLHGQAVYQMDFPNMKTVNVNSKSERPLLRLLDGKQTN